jgi:O-antigen chain-terminating methyltransferase
LSNNVGHLRRGTADKLDILLSLYFSEERKGKGVQIPGLRSRAIVRRIARRLPILRLFVATIHRVLRLPWLIRDQQRSIGTILNRQDAIARYVNRNVGHSLGKVLEKTVQLLEEQKNTQNVLLERVEKLASYCEERLNEEAMQRRQGFRDRQREIEDVRHVYNKYRTQVELTEKALKQQMEYLFRKHQEVKMELVFQGERLGSLTRHEPVTTSPKETKGADASEGNRSLDAFFAAFDEHFRGDRGAVKQRLKQYVPIVREHGVGTAEAPVVDVACGRGEWLELLKEEKLQASGVDVNEVLVRQCRDLGLTVKRSELTDHLRGLAENSVGAVSAFHIVEHLEIHALISFLDQALRVIRPGGLLLLETPNPQNVLVGSCNFYFDPTHRNPIPSPVLKFLVESRGFEVIEAFGLNPSDEKPVAADSEMAERFNEFFYGPMDYAIIARKL